MKKATKMKWIACGQTSHFKLSLSFVIEGAGVQNFAWE